MKRIMPPTYFMVLLLLTVVSHFLVPMKQLVSAPYTYLGMVLVLFGILMNIWADALFKKSRTTVKPHEDPSSLHVAGPFKISRHPMYLGMAAIILGVAVFLGSLVTLAFPLIFIIAMESVFIPSEESNLEKVFGKRYREYKKRVRRWI